MKKPLIVLLCLIVMIGCRRKTVPAAPSANTNNTTKNNTANATTAAPTSVSGTIDSVTSAPATVYTKPFIIVDGKGNMLSSRNLPPDAPKKLSVEEARAFTPAQTKNLAFRYKYIPPRILYVPSNIAKTSSRGTYYIYNKKFYYWKKPNGYFYLDENYYN
jgi:hypothetical protein